MDLPKKIPIFPLSNFIIFPKTTVPLNIFEPRYVEMVNDSMKSNKFIGMVQPKTLKNFDNSKLPLLHKIGCLGKITSFKETEDGRYLIDLKGIIRFKDLNKVEGYQETSIFVTSYCYGKTFNDVYQKFHEQLSVMSNGFGK